MIKMKLTKIEDSFGLILPDDMLEHLRVKEGQDVFAIEVRNGYLITPANPRVARQVEDGESFMDRYRDVFSRLDD